MPLSLLSLSELESAQNLAGSCLTLCDRLLASHSDSLLLPGDSIAAWTGYLPFLGLPCFLFFSVFFSCSFFFFSSSSSLSFFFLCLSSSLSFSCLSLSLFFSSRSSFSVFGFLLHSILLLSILHHFNIFILSQYSCLVILLRFGLFKVSSSEKKNVQRGMREPVQLQLRVGHGSSSSRVRSR